MLQMVRLRTSLYTTVQLRAPWGIGIPRTQAAAFHAVISGRCCFWVGEANAKRTPIELLPGDVVVLPHGHAHTFCDRPGSPIEMLPPLSVSSTPPPPELDDDPAATQVMCGLLWFEDRSANPLVSMLPPLVHFRAAANGRPAGWLEPMLQFVALESRAPGLGSDAVLARLSDVIVVQAIRAHLAELPLGERGWLRALADARLGAALQLIHQHPETPWTVARLAAKVGLSRSSFAARFTELVGEAPLAYATRWRMHYAQRLLRASNDGIARIAERVGYKAEPAFSRAFKRFVGVAPGEFRRRA
jgi:AraC-like DNA-binding protein